MDVVLGALMVAAIPLGIYLGARHRRKRLDLYRSVAARYPGSSVVDGGLWKRHELHVSHRGARIKIWMWSNKNSRGTVWSAQLPAPVGAFRVYREGVGSSIGKMLGTQDVEIGAHRGFDDHFMVKGDDPPLLRQVWSAERCRRMLARFPRGLLEGDDRELVLTEYRLLDTAPEITEGIDLVADFADCDLYGIEVLRRLDDAIVHGGPLPSAVIGGPADIRIGPVATRDGTVTRASCLAGNREPADPDRLDAIGATFSREEGQLHITWPGIETRTERLNGAIALLRELARGPSAGVFR